MKFYRGLNNPCPAGINLKKKKTMYSKAEAEEPKQSNHNATAEKMGLQIVAEFSPEQQNEMIARIRNFVVENRQTEIEKVAQHLKYLESTLESI